MKFGPAGKDVEQFARYGLVGGSCLALNLLMMWLFVEHAGMPVLGATIICFILINPIGHHLSRLLAFKEARRTYAASLTRFLVVSGLSLMANVGLMGFAVFWLGLPYLLASVCVAALFFLLNFLTHRKWTFR
ncbi:GtrA family protein [Aquabacterium sp. A7-Y]|uniref:GtrA family protein n=1 Tax=Aquabacterium sp. A7-Y TaxID=1349605 RepID=UPI00223D6D01|nr:GtrA family protein [Aquabacterium sp. A7-Y]MCW7538974.1 GtrA family protein [Aquabacterium sp. A7-Y]